MADLVEAFELFCDLLTTENGSPFTLEPWQREVLEDVFSHTETLILLPKGNGKTALLAALALFHLCSVPDAKLYVAAASRDQASLLYGYAHGFLTRSPELQSRLLARPGYREIRARAGLSVLKVLASDADTADGTGPTLALVDELHRHKNGDLYASLRDGLPKRGGTLVTISTAGSDETSTLGQLRSRALSLPELHRQDSHTRAASSTFAMHEYAVPDGADTSDLEVVKLANPSSFVTLESLAARRDSPSMQPADWLRFACNRWVADEGSTVVPMELWDALAIAPAELAGPVFLSFDVSLDRSSAAIAAAALRSDGKVHLEVAERAAGTGWVAASLAARIKALSGLGGVIVDAGGPAGSLVPQVESEIGHEVRRAGAREYAAAFGALLDSVQNATVAHLGDPGLRAALEGARRRPLGDAYALDRKNSASDISGLSAVLLALWACQSADRAPEVWDIAEVVEQMRARQAAAGQAPAEAVEEPVPAPVPGGQRFIRLEDMPSRGWS